MLRRAILGMWTGCHNGMDDAITASAHKNTDPMQYACPFTIYVEVYLISWGSVTCFGELFWACGQIAIIVWMMPQQPRRTGTPIQCDILANSPFM
jgi:hypothetical protein